MSLPRCHSYNPIPRREALRLHERQKEMIQWDPVLLVLVLEASIEFPYLP